MEPKSQLLEILERGCEVEFKRRGRLVIVRDETLGFELCRAEGTDASSGEKKHG